MRAVDRCLSLKPFDIQLRHMATISLRQLGGADIKGQAVNIAIFAQRAGLGGIGRVVPRPFADAHHAGPDILKGWV